MGPKVNEVKFTENAPMADLERRPCWMCYQVTLCCLTVVIRVSRAWW